MCSIINTRDTEVKLDDIPVVRDYSNVFPEELPSVLIEGEVEFGINLMQGT